MFKIGEFSKIAQVSTRMLRHYDEIGLFKPEVTDEATGYRYYSVKQLPTLNRIVSLRMLDFSLEEIRRLLQDALSASDIRALYKANRAKLEAQIRQEQWRLQLLETRIGQIEQGNAADAVLKEVAPQRILSLRETAPSFASMGQLIAQTRAAVRRLEPSIFGPGLAVFHDPHFEMKEVDWELGFIIEGKAPDTLPLEDGRLMKQRVLAGHEQVASSIYEGPYLSLHKGYSALGHWIEANGYLITGVGREIFWHMEPGDPTQNVTELQFPVQRAS